MFSTFLVVESTNQIAVLEHVTMDMRDIILITVDQEIFTSKIIHREKINVLLNFRVFI